MSQTINLKMLRSLLRCCILKFALKAAESTTTCLVSKTLLSHQNLRFLVVRKNVLYSSLQFKYNKERLLSYKVCFCMSLKVNRAAQSYRYISIPGWLRCLIQKAWLTKAANIEGLSLIPPPFMLILIAALSSISPLLSAQKEEARTCKELSFHLGLFGSLCSIWRCFAGDKWAKPISSNDTHGEDNWQRAYGARLRLHVWCTTPVHSLYSMSLNASTSLLACHKAVDVVKNIGY